MPTHVYLPVITLLLGFISAILTLGVRIFYNVLSKILEEVSSHSEEIAELKTWQKDHREEVSVQRQHWQDEADHVWEAVHRLEGDRRPNGPSR